MFRRSWLPGGMASRGAGGDVAVVLVHGYFCMSRAIYWQGLLPLRRELLAAGHPVFRSCVPRTGPVALRAAQLARYLDTLPQRRLILVGHSMGGLDARYAASRLDPRARISHVITIGTPHRGTAVADWALRDRVWLTRLVRFIDRGALRDLSLEAADRLNAQMPDREDVGYVSLAGSCPTAELAGTLRRLGERVALDEGANDGMVSLRSALCGPTAVSVNANHLELIGHWPINGNAGGMRQARRPQPVTALRAILGRILAGTGTGAGPLRAS